MTKFEDIKERIEAAKRLKVERQIQADIARRVWEEKLKLVGDAQDMIYDLKDELKEEKQRAFDEDGIFIGVQD